MPRAATRAFNEREYQPRGAPPLEAVYRATERRQSRSRHHEVQSRRFNTVAMDAAGYPIPEDMEVDW